MPNPAVSWANWATCAPQSSVHRSGLWLLCEAVSLGWGLRTCLYLTVSWNTEEQCTDLGSHPGSQSLSDSSLASTISSMKWVQIPSLQFNSWIRINSYRTPSTRRPTAYSRCSKKGKTVPVVMLLRHTTPQKGPCGWRMIGAAGTLVDPQVVILIGSSFLLMLRSQSPRGSAQTLVPPEALLF